jgi:hypothetical protein
MKRITANPGPVMKAKDRRLLAKARAASSGSYHVLTLQGAAPDALYRSDVEKRIVNRNGSDYIEIRYPGGDWHIP